MEILAQLAAGLVLWTFLEYAIHRWLGHRQGTFAAALHGVHHRDPSAVFAIGAWLPAALAMILMLVFTGPGAAVNLYGGALLGFALYEAFHYRLHFRLPANRIEAYLRARHLAHHDRDSQSCFGVTSPLWDRVFGTEPTLNCETVRMLAVRAPLAAKSNLGRFPRISTR